MGLEEKLAVFDEFAHLAANAVLARVGSRYRELVELARQRHIAGHERYGDGRLYEYDADRLLREADEELADAIVYYVRRLSLTP